MLDIQTFNRALKAKWITKYLDNSNQIMVNGNSSLVIF